MTSISLKLLGTLLTVGCGAVCGLLSAQNERTRLSVLDAWIEVIDRIRSEIDLYLRPIDEIVVRLSPVLVRRASAGMQRSTLQGMLLAASPYLSQECRRLLGALLGELGTSYRQEQIKLCDSFLASLRREREKIRGEQPARLRLCTVLPLCIAAGIAILLW